MATSWTLPGADGQSILGNSHLPSDSPRGVMILCHGFKGYKDYGFFPHLAQAAADAGLIAHRFNFSHSGMTNDTATFARPDLFERDTWGRQMEDLTRVHQAAIENRLPSGAADTSRLAVTWFGHSRGGVTVLAAAASDVTPTPARVIAAAAPDAACNLDEDQRRWLRRRGYLESASSRTGQVLRVGLAWLEYCEEHGEEVDPLRAIARLATPVLLIHGEADETVPLSAARMLKRAGGDNARLLTLPNANHTFNAPNPLPLESTPPEGTQRMIDAAIAFALQA